MSPDARVETIVRELAAHRSDLLAFLLSIVREFDLAEEALRRTASAVRRRAKEAPAGADFAPWARAVAKDQALRLCRAQGRQVLLSPEALDAIDRAAGAGAPGMPEHLRACLDGSDRRRRSLARMRYRDGADVSDVSRLCKTPVSKICRALSRLRVELARCVGRRSR